MCAVHLDGKRLFTGQQSQVKGSGQVNVHSIHESSSEEALLTGFEQKESRVIPGRATANRISNQSGYSNDLSTALCEFAATLESFCNPEQGEGYTLTDDERGESVTVVVEQVSWVYKSDRSLDLRWEVTVRRSEGLMTSTSRNVESVSPGSTTTLDGNDLGHTRQIHLTKKLGLRDYLVALANTPDDNAALPEGGVTRQIDVSGDKYGSQSARNSWEDSLRALLGRDNIVTYSSGFPGRDLKVMLDEFDDTRTAGDTRITSYNLRVIEGQA